jgi:hypothetical protein
MVRHHLRLMEIARNVSLVPMGHHLVRTLYFYHLRLPEEDEIPPDLFARRLETQEGVHPMERNRIDVAIETWVGSDWTRLCGIGRHNEHGTVEKPNRL